VRNVEAMKKIALSMIVLAFVASSVTLWLPKSPLTPILYLLKAALTIHYSSSANSGKIKFGAQVIVS
jgi:hypothetical protein